MGLSILVRLLKRAPADGKSTHLLLANGPRFKRTTERNGDTAKQWQNWESALVLDFCTLGYPLAFAIHLTFIY